MTITAPHPAFICADCGDKHGRRGIGDFFA